MFAFAIENFNRSKDEVESLMDLAVKLAKDLNKKMNFLNENDIKINLCGN